MIHRQALSLSPQTFRSVPLVELQQSLPSRVAVISPFVDQLMRFVAKYRNQEGSELEIETALREALANAILHGNHEDPHKRVYVTCRCSTDEAAGQTLLAFPADTYQADSVKGGFAGILRRRATEGNYTGVLGQKMVVQLQIGPDQRRSSARLH